MRAWDKEGRGSEEMVFALENFERIRRRRSLLKIEVIEMAVVVVVGIWNFSISKKTNIVLLMYFVKKNLTSPSIKVWKKVDSNVH